MHRIELINSIVRKKGRNIRYIEIGVRNGKCFFNIEAKKRMAVDPKFVIGRRTYLNAYFSDPFQWFGDTFDEITSDAFFELKRDFFSDQKPDVVFIDGLHTYSQSFKDVINSLEVLDDDGVIVMHDCNPKSSTAAYPAHSFEEAKKLNLPGWGNVWCGDVWKTIVHLRTRPDLEAFVFDADFGLGVVRKKPGNKPSLGLRPEEIESMPYDELDRNREDFLGLKPTTYWNEFISSVK